MARLHSDVCHGQIVINLFWGCDDYIDPVYGGYQRRINKSASCLPLISGHIMEIKFPYKGNEFSIYDIANNAIKEAVLRLSKVLKAPIYPIVLSENEKHKEGINGCNVHYDVEVALYERC